MNNEQLNAIIDAALDLWNQGVEKHKVVSIIAADHKCPKLLVKMSIQSFTGQRHLDR